MKATLSRMESSDEGTFGLFTLEDGSEWDSLELPWRDNQQGISCVPEGVYMAKMAYSPKHAAMVYHLQNVPDRSDVEIHAANFGGDKAKGYRCELLGCIALGEGIGQLLGQKAVLNSQKAMREFQEKTGGVDLEIHISVHSNLILCYIHQLFYREDSGCPKCHLNE